MKDIKFGKKVQEYEPEIMPLSVKGLFELMKELAGSGIKCRTTTCVFNLFPDCGIKNVHIFHGKCPHFNPKLTYKDVSPGYEHDANAEGQG